jgi:hypothetical protein
MQKAIANAIKGGHGTAMLYVAGISFILADAIPTPADAYYFNFQQKNKQKLEEGKIVPKQYWTREATAYYLSNIVWWSLVLGAMVYTKGDYTQKAKVGLGIIAGGVVLSVIHKNIKKDEELLRKTK